MTHLCVATRRLRITGIERSTSGILSEGADICNCKSSANEWCMIECESIIADKGLDLKKRKSSTQSRGKSCVNLTPANDGPGYATCASRRRWRFYSAK